MSEKFRFLKRSDKKSVLFLILTIVLVTAVVGSTIAYIVVISNFRTNVFEPPEIDVQISNNEIINTSDIDVYVRVTTVASIVDSEGKMLPYTPEITVNINDGWVKGADGFIYCTKALAPNQTVKAISSVECEVDSNEDYTVQVVVLSEVIQSVPSAAVTSSWSAVTGVDAGGNLVVDTAN